MKSQVALAIILSCIVAGVAVASCVEYAAGFPKSSYSFTLTATGRARDPSHNLFDVSLSVCGKAHGELTHIAHLHVTGGDLDVTCFGAFSVIKGDGTLIQRLHYILIVIKITPPYGGKMSLWILRGTTGRVSGNTLPVSFSSHRVILPLPDHPRLQDLRLTGTITAD